MMFVLTLLVLLFWPTSSKSAWHQFASFIELLSSNFFVEGRKEKTDDDEAEYEMLWDAEGSMHLVRKTLAAPPRNQSDTGSVERYKIIYTSHFAIYDYFHCLVKIYAS